MALAWCDHTKVTGVLLCVHEVKHWKWLHCHLKKILIWTHLSFYHTHAHHKTKHFTFFGKKDQWTYLLMLLHWHTHGVFIKQMHHVSMWFQWTFTSLLTAYTFNGANNRWIPLENSPLNTGHKHNANGFLQVYSHASASLRQYWDWTALLCAKC